MNEFEIIDEITSNLRQQSNVVLGPGDDAAILATPDARVAVSTDILVEGVHFRPEWTTPYQLGRRAAAQNFADIAAMGGRPTALVVGVAAPRSQDPVWFTEVSRGLQDECDLVGASVIGGDLSSGQQLMIAATVLGDLDGRPPITRAGANVGDLVAVAGRLGWSAAGLAALQSGADIDGAFLDAYRAPTPPYAAGVAAALAGACAMIDVSDGLLADARHIADASNVTINLDSSLLLPDAVLEHAATVLGRAAREFVLTGGEDHALLAVFHDGTAVPEPFRVIGRVEQRGAHTVVVDGLEHLGTQGHDHFG